MKQELVQWARLTYREIVGQSASSGKGDIINRRENAGNGEFIKQCESADLWLRRKARWVGVTVNILVLSVIGASTAFTWLMTTQSHDAPVWLSYGFAVAITIVFVIYIFAPIAYYLAVRVYVSMKVRAQPTPTEFFSNLLGIPEAVLEADQARRSLPSTGEYALAQPKPLHGDRALSVAVLTNPSHSMARIYWRSGHCAPGCKVSLYGFGEKVPPAGKIGGGTRVGGTADNNTTSHGVFEVSIPSRATHHFALFVGLESSSVTDLDRVISFPIRMEPTAETDADDRSHGLLLNEERKIALLNRIRYLGGQSPDISSQVRERWRQEIEGLKARVRGIASLYDLIREIRETLRRHQNQYPPDLYKEFEDAVNSAIAEVQEQAGDR